MRLRCMRSNLTRRPRSLILRFFRSWLFSKYRLWRSSIKCPEAETALLNRRRADSTGSPSPTLTLTLTSREVVGRGQVSVLVAWS